MGSRFRSSLGQTTSSRMLHLWEGHLADLLVFVPEEQWVSLLSALAGTCRARRNEVPLPYLTWVQAAGRALTPNLCTAAVAWMSARACALCLRLQECMPRADEFVILTSSPALRELDCMGTLLCDQTLACAFANPKPLLRRLVLSHCSDSVTRRSVASIAAQSPSLKHLRLSHVQVEADLTLLRAAAVRAAGDTSGAGPVILLDVREPSGKTGTPDYCIIYALGAPAPQIDDPGLCLEGLSGLKRLEVSSSCWPGGAPHAQAGLLRLPVRDDRHTELRAANKAWDALRRLQYGTALVQRLRKLYAEEALNVLRIRGPPCRGRARLIKKDMKWRRWEATWAST